MKKTAMLLIMLIGTAGLTACANADANAGSSSAEGKKMSIEMELDKNYDDKDPFVNERLFYVTKDLDGLSAEGTFKMDGESIVLEVKNNKTKEVLWSKTWEENVKSEPLSITLKNLKKEDEYVVCLTGRKVNYAAIGITFDSGFVKEREKPSR